MPRFERYSAIYYYSPGYATVTNTRLASLHGLTVGPVSLSTTPVPFRKPRARHELARCRAAGVAGFRLRLSGGRCAPSAIR